jgi:hypothetical protein
MPALFLSSEAAQVVLKKKTQNQSISLTPIRHTSRAKVQPVETGSEAQL